MTSHLDLNVVTLMNISSQGRKGDDVTVEYDRPI